MSALDRIGTIIGALIGAFAIWAARGLGAGVGLWIALKVTGVMP